MKSCACPHCGAARIAFPKIPKDVIFVMPCPKCRELILAFRDKVIALSRRVIEEGTFEEQKSHLAEVIAELLQAGILGASLRGVIGTTAPEEFQPDFEDDDGANDRPAIDNPITESEFDRFVRLDLNRIDEARYFKKHFG